MKPQQRITAIAVLAVVIIAACGLLGWATRSGSVDADQRAASTALREARDQLDDAQARLAEAQKTAGDEQKSSAAALAQRATITRTLTSLTKQRNELQQDVAKTQLKVDTLVRTPTAEGTDRAAAIAAVTAAGLEADVELRDGTCADYRNHFVKLGFGFTTVADQQPAAGSPLPRGGTVRLTLFDPKTHWEAGCGAKSPATPAAGGAGVAGPAAGQ